MHTSAEESSTLPAVLRTDQAVAPDRRRFITALASGLAAGAVSGSSLAYSLGTTGRFKAVVFDGFAVLDPRPVFELAGQLFPGAGNLLTSAWKTHLFEYQWLHALGGNYVDFLRAAEDALVFSANSLGLSLGDGPRQQLMDAFLSLKAWPDVQNALLDLRRLGLRLSIISNMTPAMLQNGVVNSRLGSFFEQVISTDRIRTHKPDRRAYQLGPDLLGLRSDEILYVAFAGWDVAGAKWFGYPTFWANRSENRPEELGTKADGTGRDFRDLVTFVREEN